MGKFSFLQGKKKRQLKRVKRVKSVGLRSVRKTESSFYKEQEHRQKGEERISFIKITVLNDLNF